MSTMMEPSTKNCRRRALLNTRHKFSRKSTQPFCEMSDRWRGRRLDGLVGGSRFRCGPAGCRQDLSCLAGHPTTRAGHFLDFGFGPGEHLCVRSSAIDGAGLGIFAKTIFRAGDIITVYDGHVSLRIFAPIYAYQTVCASFDHLHAIPGTEFIIWGFKYPTHARGLGSFANHSRLPNHFQFFLLNRNAVCTADRHFVHNSFFHQLFASSLPRKLSNLPCRSSA